ncbi:hypothetical protein HYALB_00004915 [Hymenoscyphus albidus]|uniref:C2H2-type domain-containing protein n=1 Tax=Hymenoscyphus albidus TaxID=595503 RepID=A0A9N9LIA2_9HELO|nr:hypothetical protein HYALB_00004915 [Hymenoscyphus albidus]
MSRTSMVSIGLEALAGIIEGRNSTAIVQAFAFTHIAYAFSILIDDEIKVHTQEWFQDSLSWVSDLGSERQRTSYAHIARALWQPLNPLTERIFPRLFPAGDENRLLLVCRRFLDVSESFGSSDKIPSDGEKIAACKTRFVKYAKKQVIDELIKTVSIEAFIEDVVKVEKRLNRGYIQNVRELELELMCAGKLASQSELAYTRFLSHVTKLCNSLYGPSPIRERAVYHIGDISLVKKLLPEELFSEQNDEEEREFELELEDDLPVGFEVGMMGTCDERSRIRIECVLHSDEDLENGFSSPQENQTQPPSPLVTIPIPLHRSKSSHNPSTPKPSHPIQNHPKSSNPTSQEPPNYQCSLCEYIPSGKEKWKPSNLRRHRRTQHASTETKGLHICPWPGCRKSFTRSDNLRSHVRDKGHEVGVGGGKEVAEEEEDEGRDGERERERVRKRRKVGRGRGGE